MGVESPDGGPPTHRGRRSEWRWLAIGACLLAVAGLVWAAARQVHWATLLAGSALVLVLLASAAPVWGAALLRGGEERRARREARAELAKHESPEGG